MLKEMHCYQQVEKFSDIFVSCCRLHSECNVYKRFGKEKVSRSVPLGSVGVFTSFDASGSDYNKSIIVFSFMPS